MVQLARLNRPPYHVRIHAWGRAATGWWGAISWRQRVSWSGGQEEMSFAAWVPAATLRPGDRWRDDEPVPRAKLETDSRFWPVPPIGPCWYVGAWLDGNAPCPPGIMVVTGPAWRKRAKLAP